MPVFDNLPQRISEDADWNTAYQTNLEKAKHVSERVWLIHLACGGKFSLYDLLDQYGGMLPLSNSRPKDHKTRKAERALRIPSSLYFYAGRACPEFGEVAFAFSLACEVGRRGAITPFDSGGLHHNKIYPLNQQNIVQKRTHYRFSRVPRYKWRKQFAEYLAAYFDPLSEYWDGIPVYNDPEEVFHHPDNEWRAWVFEVRFYAPLAITEMVCWFATRDEMERSRKKLRNLSRSGHRARQTAQWLMTHPPTVATSSEELIDCVEREAKRRCGL